MCYRCRGFKTFTDEIVATIAPNEPAVDHVRVIRSAMPSIGDEDEWRDSLIIVAASPAIEGGQWDGEPPDWDKKNGSLYLTIAVVDEATMRMAKGFFDLDSLRAFHNTLGNLIDRQEQRCAAWSSKQHHDLHNQD